MVSVFGENLTRLTTEDANYRYPQFSSDGRYLAFVRICEPSGALVFYDPRSKELRVISEKSGGYGAPVWSPDSNRLAFTRFLGGKTELILYELGDQRLTTIANWDGKVGSLTWSPTGKQLAFAGATGNGYEVYAINADGTRLAQLTNTGGSALAPSWSPVEDVLAYVRLRYPLQAEGGLSDGSVHLMNLTHPTSQPITLTEWTSTRPVWSPDGQWITVGGVTGVAIVNRIDLTTTGVISGSALFIPRSWSSHGLVVFDASCCGMHQIHIAELKNRGQSPVLDTRLNGEEFWQVDANLSPDGDWVAFSGLLDALVP